MFQITAPATLSGPALCVRTYTQEGATSMSLATFVQQLLTGVSLGGAYALIAIGYTMVYGILRLINFAHGDLFMMSGYFMIFAIA